MDSLIAKYGTKSYSFSKKIVAPPPLPPPSTYPQFARIKHWHERYGRSYIAQRRIEENNPRLHAGASGDPAVFQLVQKSSDRPVSMTPEIEWWIKRLFVESANGQATDAQVIQAYRNAWSGQKAFNNFASWSDGYQSVVLNAHMGKEPMKLQPTICNGATVKVLGPKTTVVGHQVYPIEVLNAQDKNTVKRTLKDAWWMIFAATNSTIEPAPEGNVDPFPYLNDHDIVIPLMGNNTTVAYVEAGWIEFLGNIQYPVYPYYRTWVTETEWKLGRGIPL